MVTVGGAIDTFEVSLLCRVTVTPPGGAGVPSVTGNGTDWLGARVVLAGTDIEPCTVTFAVASGIFGRLLAWMIAEPPATPVTATDVVVAFAAKLAVEGTVATPVLLELRFTLRPPAGAGADSVSVMV